MSFPNTTLLVIAHRLNTVMDMDRILGLSEGKVLEFESPAKLVKEPKSLLYSLVQATGKDGAQHLIDIATGKIDFLRSLASQTAEKKKEKKKEKDDTKSKKSKKSRNGGSKSKKDTKESDGDA